MGLVNRKEEVLMQKRSMYKIAFPGRWDISSAGHVGAGEDVKETGRREMEEELGLTGMPEMEFVLKRVCIASVNNGTYKEHEIEYVYAIFIDDQLLPKLKFSLQKEEVMDVQWMPMKHVQQAWISKDEDFVNLGDPTLFDLLLDFAHNHMKQQQ